MLSTKYKKVKSLWLQCEEDWNSLTIMNTLARWDILTKTKEMVKFCVFQALWWKQNILIPQRWVWVTIKTRIKCWFLKWLMHEELLFCRSVLCMRRSDRRREKTKLLLRKNLHFILWSDPANQTELKAVTRSASPAERTTWVGFLNNSNNIISDRCCDLYAVGYNLHD